MSRSWIRASLLVGVAALACNIPTHDSPELQPTPSPIDVEPLPEPTVAVAGCHGLSTKPTCLLLPVKPDESAKPLYLWLAGDDPQLVTVHLDGQPLSSEVLEIERHVDGIWIQLRSPTPGVLEVVHSGQRPFTLEIERLSTTYADAYALLKHDTVAARGALEREWPQLDPREAFLLDCTLTRHSDLQPEPLAAALAELRVRAEAVDEAYCVGLLATRLINMLTDNQDFEAAASNLDHLRRHQQLDLIARINAEHYAAILARDNGLLGDASRGFARAALLSERIGNEYLLSGALIEQALVLQRLGRLDEAMQRAERAVALVEGQGPLELDVRFNKAWIEVLRRAQEPSFSDPAPELRELIVAFADDPEMAAVTQLNLAVAIIQTGDHTQARRELAKVPRKQLVELRQLLYYHLTEFRIELAAGKPSIARQRLDRADLLAKLSHDREFGLELLEARAELELYEGNEQAALAVFDAADDLAETLARQVPANAGRSNFWTTLSRSRRRHVELALDTGDSERALCTILGARTRHLWSLATGLGPERAPLRDDDEYAAVLREVRRQQRALEASLDDEWKLADDQLQGWLIETTRARAAIDEQLERALSMREHQPPAWHCADARPSKPGVALLTAYPSADGASWWFLLDRNGEIAWERVEDDENPELIATRALERFAALGQLDGVTDLVVVPLGKLLAVNFQTLAHARELRVRHALGLGSTNAGSNWAEVAAVVGDGSPNLSELEHELAEVRKSLVARGWSLTEVWDPSANEPPRMLHYGGHAARVGQDGWDSHLDLPDGAVTSEQMLLERRAPALVVLGACDAGAIDVKMLDGGMNVAVALLFAGAQLVIAADREVEDSSASALAQALYAALPERAATDADAMVAALTEVQRVDPRFRAWRAWTP